MRVALDTNVLAYAEGVNGEDRKAVALRIMNDFAEHELIVPAQAFGELFVVLTRKAKRETADARSAVLEWSDSFALIDTTPGVILEAMELVTTHRLGFWDSVMLAGAAQAGRLVRPHDVPPRRAARDGGPAFLTAVLTGEARHAEGCGGGLGRLEPCPHTSCNFSTVC